MTHNSSIAIIDNDPLVLFTTEHMLKSCIQDIDIVTYKNPKEFILDLVSETIEVPSLILCDYDMPEMTGLEVHNSLKKILTNQSDFVFYLISSAENIETYAQQFNSDFFYGSYKKPLNLNEVEEIVNASLADLAS